MEIEIEHTEIQLEKLESALEEFTDCGSRDEGWASDEFDKVRCVVFEAIEAARNDQ